MGESPYLDFDIIIERAGDKYRARVIGSPAGQASGEFSEPFSNLELENFILRLGQPRQGARRIDSSMMGTVKKFGEKLFRTVFDDDVYACYLRSMDVAAKEDKGLRLRLRIDVPEFHDLPWEYLYNPQINQFPALSKNTPIVRYFDLPYATRPLYVKPPLKILTMISSPEEYPPLDVEGEWDRLNKSLKNLINRNIVKLERLEQPTLLALQHSLRREPVHIFHYIGHGKYFEQRQDGMLLMENGNGRGTPISGQYLGTILHDHRSLQLVVLNACEGARTSTEDPYAGVAQTLVQQGIPAVIAMQFEIYEEAALTFGQEFYSAVVDGYPVDAALSEARKAIFATGNETEWGTPVLFTRSPDSILFRKVTNSEVPEAAEPFEPEQPAVKESDKGAFDRAMQDEIKRLTDEKSTQEQRVQFLLNSMYEQANMNISLKDWGEAHILLEKIHAIQPSFKDVTDLLRQVEAEQDHAQKIELLLVKVRSLIEEKGWTEALKLTQVVLDLSPENIEAQSFKTLLQSEIEREIRISNQQSILDASSWQNKPPSPASSPKSTQSKSKPSSLPK